MRFIRSRSLIVNLFLLFAVIIFLLQPLEWQITLPNEFWIRQAALFVVWIAIFQVVSRVLVPGYLFKNKQPAFFGLLVGSIILSLFLVKAVELFINYNESMSTIFPKSHKKSPYSIDPIVTFTTILITGVSASVEIVKKWYTDSESRLLLEKDKTASELLFLKAQINPHFFFNTLNNIYSLSRIDSNKAGDAIYTLSHMMRYVLYDTNKDTTISKEVKFISDYIKLMQLRLTEKVVLIFDKPEVNVDHVIAPMLLLPFVENAFKHGLSSTENTKIMISISTSETAVVLEVRNTIVQQQSQNMEESNGIGLINTKRRLDLMYPGKYELDIRPNAPENEYFVRLKLIV